MCEELVVRQSESAKSKTLLITIMCQRTFILRWYGMELFPPVSTLTNTLCKTLQFFCPIHNITANFLCEKIAILTTNNQKLTTSPSNICIYLPILLPPCLALYSYLLYILLRYVMRDDNFCHASTYLSLCCVTIRTRNFMAK